MSPSRVRLPFYISGRWSLRQVLAISRVVNPLLKPHGVTLSAIDVTDHNDNCAWYLLRPIQIATRRPVHWYVG